MKLFIYFFRNKLINYNFRLKKKWRREIVSINRETNKRDRLFSIQKKKKKSFCNRVRLTK